MARRNWMPQEDALLTHLVNAAPKPISWARVSKCFYKRTQSGCKSRWVNSLDPNRNTAPFTQEEDDCIQDFLQCYPRSWNSCANTLNTNRTPLMIMKRWNQLKEHGRLGEINERQAVDVVPEQKNLQADVTFATLPDIEDASKRGKQQHDERESVHLQDVEGALDVLRSHFAKNPKFNTMWLDRMPTALFATTTLSGQCPDKEMIVKQFLEDRTLWTPTLQHSIQSLESFVDCLFS
jgi:hypothetical protein